MPNSIKATIRNTPLLGEGLVRLKRALLSSPPKPKFQFEREPITADEGNPVGQARNLLSYTKISGEVYAGCDYPAGYHTIEIEGEVLRGQRNPRSRLELVTYDFTGKSVLDVGSNQGGMLHAMDGKLSWGVGIDFDPRLVNAANRIARIRNDSTLAFYTFDLERDPLPLIEDFLPNRPDVIFLLAVCVWISNWKQVVQFLSRLSDRMLFEANGTQAQQATQIALLRSIYRYVTVLAATSEDDPSDKSRQLLWCEREYMRNGCRPEIRFAGT